MDGILNICKEKGFTSHDVVAKLRGITRQRKIGHTGTLDPDAEGVLPVCLGKATKVCGLITDKDKTYEAVLLLGRATDTQDVTGQTVSVGDTRALTGEEAREAILSFTGEYEQIPPMYSAIRVGGKRLYELAREGREVERKPRQVTIYKIDILDMELPRARILVKCSKGAYIRTLCHDIGEKLGCGGCMESLLRRAAGPFCIEDSIRLSEAERLMKAGALKERLMPIDAVFAALPALRAAREGAARLANGNPLPAELLRRDESGGHEAAEGDEVRVYADDGRFAAIYRYHAKEAVYKPVKMFL